MSLILRWFEANGERHRAFFREREPAGERELVIAGPNWQCVTREASDARLEDFSEDALVDLAMNGRSQRPD
jgi:hypothetical protein